MTREEMIQLAGLKPVREGKALEGRGLLLGFPVRMVEHSRALALIFSVEGDVSGKQIKEINKKLKEVEYLKGKLSVGNSLQGDTNILSGSIVATIHFKNEEPKILYDRAMAALERLFAEAELRPQTTCPICMMSSGDALAEYDGKLCVVHMTCLRRWKDERQETLELKGQNAGLLRGLIGGLAGGIAGALPALLAVHFFSYMVGLLYALIPLGIFFGWKMLGGKLNKLTTVFTILYSLVLGVGTLAVASWLSLRAEFPMMRWTLIETIEMFYLDSAFFREYLMGDTLFALGCTVLGIFFAWRAITSTDKAEIAANESAFEEAIPLSRTGEDRSL